MDVIKYIVIFIIVCMVAGWLGDQKTSTCQWCQQEFKGNTPYCSQQCYNAAVAAGYENPYADDTSDDYGPGPF